MPQNSEFQKVLAEKDAERKTVEEARDKYYGALVKLRDTFASCTCSRGSQLVPCGACNIRRAILFPVGFPDENFD